MRSALLSPPSLVRDLSPAEIEDLLRRRTIGRLGVFDREHKRVYVVPVSYVYREGAVYLHSAPGLKLQLLHEQPASVCFEVDDIADEAEWQSALVWGRYEEIRDTDERQRVLRSFGERLFRGPLRERQHVGRIGLLGGGETVYRIVLTDMTGRANGGGWIATESD